MSKREEIIEFRKHNPKLRGSEIAAKLGVSRKYVYKVLMDIDWNITELIISDLHIPYHDIDSVNLTLDFAEDYDPNIIVLGGDIIDFYSVSYWNKNPKAIPIEVEVNKTIEILSFIRARFPKARIVYMEGNHEYRLKSYLASKAKELYGLPGLQVPNMLQLDKFNIEYVDAAERIRKSDLFKIGNLYHLHGHELRVSWRTPSLARNVFMQTLDNCIISHFHRSDEFMQRNIHNQIKTAYAVGCLCELSAEYSTVNNWNHGFCLVHYNNLGEFLVSNKRIINGIIC